MRPWERLRAFADVFSGTLDEAFDFADGIPAPETNIYVNGVPHTVARRQLTYEEVVGLSDGYHVCHNPSVTWGHKGSGGILMHGQSVSVQAWMQFKVANTGNA